MTFIPDAGFWGTVETSYVVYDRWGVGVEAALTVTVDADCTITGVVGVVRIEGTDGDDVICVPDRGDRRAFHVIDDDLAGGDTLETDPRNGRARWSPKGRPTVILRRVEPRAEAGHGPSFKLSIPRLRAGLSRCEAGDAAVQALS